MSEAVDLDRFLEEQFGHTAFRPGQREVVQAVLAGRDALALMPTGGGKSLCYQLPASILEGVTLVVSPLIALMKDQVDSLVARGFPATYINSSLTPAERARRQEGCRAGRFRLVYIAPERLRSVAFREVLAATRVVRLAVDEAHCISQWGHDFRPDYMRLGELREAIGSPPTLALTATATTRVRRDIVRQLGLVEPGIFLAGFERPNLFFSVRRPRSVAQKLEACEAAVSQLGGPGIIYAATRKNVERIAGHLSRPDRPAAAYHGGLPDDARAETQDAFMRGEVAVMVATNAFGMGVDKANIRFVLHYDIPGGMEAYYQEAGRAGRDGKPAQCCLLYNYADVRIQEFFLKGANPSLELIEQVYARAGQGASLAGVDSNEMAVATAAGILERRGLLERGPGGIWSLRGSPVAAGALPLDREVLAEKAAHDRERLAAIVRYAETRTCRRKLLLEYFTDRSARQSCDGCDNCLGWHRRPARSLTAEEVRVVRIALSAVARLDDRFGKSRIAQVLVGSAAEPVRRFGLERLPTYGKLRGMPARGVGDLLENLADAGLLQRRVLHSTGSLGGAVLSISPAGRRLMRAETATMDLDWPGSLTAVPSRARTRALTDAAAVPGQGSAPDPALLEALKQMRLRHARQRSVPPYVVFHDRTLEAIAASRPSSREQLSAITGIGPAKLSRYGKELLEVVRAALPPA
ncbi:MAG: RecQ family ATP-dependent DNA helicase [Candidatus Binatia bacterium]